MQDGACVLIPSGDRESGENPVKSAVPWGAVIIAIVLICAAYVIFVMVKKGAIKGKGKSSRKRR